MIGGSGLLLALVLSLAIDASQRAQLGAGAGQAAQREARILGATVTRFVEAALDPVRRLAARPALASGLLDADTVRLQLEQTRQEHPELAWVALLDPTGRVMAATGTLLETVIIHQESGWDDAAQRPLVGRWQRWPSLADRLGDGPDDTRPFLELSAPVVDTEGRTQGLVLALLDWRRVQQSLGDMTAPGSTTTPLPDAGATDLLLLLEQRSVDAQRPYAVTIGPPALQDGNLALPLLDKQSGRADIRVMDWPDTAHMLSAFVPVAMANGHTGDRWIFVQRQPAASAFAPADRLRQQVLVVALLGSAMFAAVSWWLAGRVTRPVAALSAAATRLRMGQDDALAKALPPTRADELSILRDALQDLDDERRRQTTAQRRSAQRYQALFDTSPDGICVTVDGDIVMINPAGRALFGVAEEAGIVGQALAPWFDDADGTYPAEHLPPGMRGVERMLVRADGTRVPVEVSYSSFHDGDRPAVLVQLQDITERRQAALALEQHQATLEHRVADRTAALQAALADLRCAEGRLQRANGELIESARRATAASEAKSAFLANMSHEIRTPMNAILGLAQIVLEEPLPGETRSTMQTLQSSGMALMALLDDVLDYAKIEAGHLRIETRPLQPADVLQRAAELFRARARQRGLDLRVRIDPAVPPAVMGDALRLSQVVHNLLGNAVKFTDAGHVELSATVVPADDDGSRFRLLIAVSDTGIGIDEATRDHLFQPFTQADGSITRRFGGTGLGLAISRRLVELMGGRIGVDARPGGGSEFWFDVSLALADAVEVPAGEAPAAQAAPVGLAALSLELQAWRGAEVLVAEDNAVNRLVARETLTRLGLTVTLVEDGAQAVAAVRDAPSRFALVVMDLHMPVMDGCEACRALQADPGPAGPPVVAMSAAVMAEDRARSRAAGMVAHIAKPVLAEQLVDVISRCARRPVGHDGTTALGAPARTGHPEGAPTAHATARDLPLFDRAQALRGVAGNEGLLLRLLNTFVGHAGDMAGEVQGRLHAGDLKGAREAAHSIKGSAAAVGAARLAAAAGRVDLLLRALPGNAPASTWRPAVERFENDLQHTLARIRRECTGSAASTSPRL